MKQVFLRKTEGTSRLLLFFAGWGAEPCIFKYDGLTEEKGTYDILMCYDYRSLDFDRSLTDGYGTVMVLAWSMGVWAAGQVLSDLGLTDSRTTVDGTPISGRIVHRPPELTGSRIAVNGTPYPVHDSYGIPETIFDGTLAMLSDRTLYKFRRRMCGSQATLDGLLGCSLSRPLEELREELAAIGEAVRRSAPRPFTWTGAIVGLQDMIFPAANQKNAWESLGVPVSETDIPHWDKDIFRKLLCSWDTSTNSL